LRTFGHPIYKLRDSSPLRFKKMGGGGGAGERKGGNKTTHRQKLYSSGKSERKNSSLKAASIGLSPVESAFFLSGDVEIIDSSCRSFSDSRLIAGPFFFVL